MTLMPTYESLPPKAQEVARAMSDAARQSMMDAGLWPLGNDDAARFDEACAVFLLATVKTERGLRDLAAKMRREMGIE